MGQSNHAKRQALQFEITTTLTICYALVNRRGRPQISDIRISPAQWNRAHFQPSLPSELLFHRL